MKHRKTALKGFFPWLLLSIGASAYLEGLRLAVSAPFSLRASAARFVLVVGLTFAAHRIRPHPAGKAQAAWSWLNIAVVGMGAVIAFVYALTAITWAAWVVLIVLYMLLFGVDTALTHGRRPFWRWGIRSLLALAGGVIPIAIAQVESHFADEEFFVALQALALSILWLLLLGARNLLPQSKPLSTQGVRLDNRWLAAALFLLALASLAATGRTYQRSFYPAEASTYPGITRENPFLCSEAQPNPQTFDGEEVFHRLLRRIEANPYKGTPEYGMLALGTGDQRWARLFREHILDEVAQGRYTGPAHSVKSVQHEAALRVYYFPRVRDAFPDLFSSEEVTKLRAWFADINRRAMTVEWVDWMYALAFTKWPEGPYENQENGSGLLALLEHEGLAAPELSSANRDYLERNQRGWLARFRNTDDAITYQPEWINNAYFQLLYTDGVPEDKVRLSFDWLLAQTLPDGSPLRYNHPWPFSPVGVFYLGAELLEEPRYLWLAGHALEEMGTEEGYIFAQPGVESPVQFKGRSPSIGSCLLYGGSGLPNQIGPLAPDKVVFRDDWSADSPYLLLNLRFSGWHRYKASNTVTLMYQSGSLVVDVLDGKPFEWLPTGRSLFRDKRVPRENLNGLVVERTGMSSVLYVLTSVGGPWAQDPPRYADVVAFETGDKLDWSHTQLVDWRGWQHDRRVYFYHDRGPIVVIDEAVGPSRGQAALTWHLSGGERSDDSRIRLQRSEGLMEVLFVPISPGGQLVTQKDVEDSLIHTQYYPPTPGSLQMATVFLPGRWADAEVVFDRRESVLRITDGQMEIAVPLREGN